MNYSILFTDPYLKKAKKFFIKHKNLISQYEKTLRLLEINPFNASLRLHKIKLKNHNNIYSVAINISYRIIIEFIIEDEKIIPLNIGSHDMVY